MTSHALASPCRRRLVITLRSLYTYLRLLPAYRMYRACKVGAGQLCGGADVQVERHVDTGGSRRTANLRCGMSCWRPFCSLNRCTPSFPSPLQRQRGANFTLGYRLHSTLPGRAAGASSARRLQSFRFGGVDTPYGQFRISVDYQPASTVTILEQTTSPPPLPQIIADYLGASGGGEGGAPLRHAMSASAFPGPAGSARSPRQASVDRKSVV